MSFEFSRPKSSMTQHSSGSINDPRMRGRPGIDSQHWRANDILSRNHVSAVDIILFVNINVVNASSN